MSLANIILFPHDLEEDPAGPEVYPSLYRPFGVPAPADIAAGGVLQSTMQFLGGLYLRVQAFNLSVSFALDSGTTDSFSITLSAVTAGDVGLGAESEICQHMGWYGIGTSTGANAVAARFGESVYTNGGFTFMGRTQIPFFLDMLSDISFTSINWGKSDPGDNCPITLTLPETVTGLGFDGTGITTLPLQFGGRIPLGPGVVDKITGSGTLTAISFWEYNRGDGPIYDSATGFWLRDPYDPQFQTIF